MMHGFPNRRNAFSLTLSFPYPIQGGASMFLYFWCVLSLTLAALLMGTSFAHVLEMPAKLRYDGPLWLQVQHSLYRVYGSIGGAIEVAAIVAAAILAVVLRDWRPALIAALAGPIFVDWGRYRAGFETEILRSVYASDALFSGFSVPRVLSKLTPLGVRNGLAKRTGQLGLWCDRRDIWGYGLVYLGRKTR
jgi:hypothetical protein